MKKKKILFVCEQNRLRSPTAETLFRDSGYNEVKSAGTADTAVQPLTQELLEWADKIYVFEKKHRNSIHKKFPAIYAKKSIECLYIPDRYDNMDPGLIRILKERLSNVLAPDIENV
jgi:predicted protein tyrosine phosphatase